MKREQFLRNRLEMASHNLMCYSANYSMTEPKEVLRPSCFVQK